MALCGPSNNTTYHTHHLILGNKDQSKQAESGATEEKEKGERERKRTLPASNLKLVLLWSDACWTKTKSRVKKKASSSEKGNADAFFSIEKQLNRIWLTNVFWEVIMLVTKQELSHTPRLLRNVITVLQKFQKQLKTDWKCLKLAAKQQGQMSKIHACNKTA